MQSAFAKLARAKMHRDALKADVEAFRAREPHDWVLQQTSYRDPNDRLTFRVVVKVNEEKPDHWGLTVGDVLTNLRAALDHSVFGHAEARSTLTPQQERSLYFPILTDPQKWQATQANLSPLVDSAVLAVIDQSQPFHFTQQQGGPDWHPLAVLNSLVNQDKHRAVRTVSYVNEDFDIVDSELPVASVDAQPVEMLDGAVVATVTLELPPPTPVRLDGTNNPGLRPVNFQVQNGYIEKIELPDVGDTRPLLFVVDSAVDAVEQVLNQLQAAGC
ncbi:hypothetical protein H7K33_07335 [Mycobacterium paraense]|uniref:hypothetical protein n=1 Tax=Mycobacterium paraense TaxID=767916 RepID=UPI000A15866D|nr:hypothetical protein [Mycobacterium paraense]MCV7442033.1 hypothetical protein [Mycobacterium paraense]ORW41041.1 hypothetical protein AWB89_21185 [Mycobacterium paraense]